jgi:hypothetical protein
MRYEFSVGEELEALPDGTVVQFDGKEGWFVLARKSGNRVVLGPFDRKQIRRITGDSTL